MIDLSQLSRRSVMVLKITSKRQVTFPQHVLDDLDLVPGDRVMLIASEDGYVLKPRTLNLSRLAPLKDRIPRNRGAFDLGGFRRESHDRPLRD